MTTTAETRRLAAGGCAGDGCDARDPWPLHHVRHRTVFCRLCTSCVLKYHPGFFCAACFDLLNDGNLPQPSPATSPAAAVVRCARCPSVAHAACVADPAAPYFCPCCANPDGFSYFPAGQVRSLDERHKSIDLTSAKVLLTAAQLAAVSMSCAVAKFRNEAEKKVKEAAVARKRAREMLERVISISKDEKEKRKEAKAIALVQEVVEPKKKTPKLSSTVASMVGQKRVQNRDRDRWMRFQEPIPSMPRPSEGVVEEKNKVPLPAIVPNHGNADMKDKLGNLPHGMKLVGQAEKEERRVLPGSQGGFVKQEEGVTGRC